MNNEQVLAALDACLAVLYEVIAEDIPAKLDTAANEAIDIAEAAKQSLTANSETDALLAPADSIRYGSMGHVYQYKPTVGEFPRSPIGSRSKAIGVMNIGEAARHVGAWEGEGGIVCFGSWQAVRAFTLKMQAQVACDRPSPAPVAWEEAQRICNLPQLDEAFRGFSEDPTGDNATGLVRLVLEAARDRSSDYVRAAVLAEAVQRLQDAGYTHAHEAIINMASDHPSSAEQGKAND